MKLNKPKIWHSPWLYTESAMFVLAIILIGFLIQYTIGEVDFSLFAAPVNIFAGSLMIALLVLFSLARKTVLYRSFTGVPFSVTLIAALLLLGLTMGLIPQFANNAAFGNTIVASIGLRHITSSWSFLFVYILTLLSLGALIIRRLIAFQIQDYAFHLNHIGLWILLFAAGLGTADTKRYVMHVKEGEMKSRAFDENKKMEYLPIAIQLNDFDMQEYPPKLALVNRENGALQPGSSYYQLNDRKTSATLGNWQIRIDEYLPQAMPDNPNLKPIPLPIAKLTATHLTTRQVHEGWISSGNAVLPPMTLALDTLYSIIMIGPEPKQFLSDIDVFMKDGSKTHARVEVNKPLTMGNWTIYQFGYDHQAGSMSTYSSLELVYDPWLYAVYAGMLMLSLGSICLICFGNKKKKTQYDME